MWASVYGVLVLALIGGTGAATEERRTTRRLSQSGDCDLSSRQVNRLFSDGAWTADSDFLEEDASRQLQRLVDCAEDGDIVVLDTGTAPVVLDAAVVIRKNITLRGEAQGDLIPVVTCGTEDAAVFDIRRAMVTVESIGIEDCALEGDVSPILLRNAVVVLRDGVFVNNAATSGGVVRGRGASTLWVLSCTFHSNSATEFGGAIHLEEAERLLVVDSTFVNNSAEGTEGGAIRVSNSAERSTDVSIRGSEFEDNQCTNERGNGGAVFLFGWTRTEITDTVFRRNTAPFGAAVALFNGTAPTDAAPPSFRMANNDFIKNEASEQGGGLCVFFFPRVDVVNCRFRENNATLGAGVYHLADRSEPGYEASEGFYSGCRFVENEAESGAAFFADNSTHVHIHSSQFLQNTAEVSGAAVQGQRNASMVMFNAEFRQNEAGERQTGLGGAIASFEGVQISIQSCRFDENTAGLRGGAIYLRNDDTEAETRTAVEITESRLRENNAENGGAVYALGFIRLRISASLVEMNEAFLGGALDLEGLPEKTADSDILTQAHEEFGLDTDEEEASMEAMLVASTVASNTAFVSGAIHAHPRVVLRLQSCTVSDNSADWAGGIYIAQGSLFAADVLFLNNSAAESAGGMMASSSSGRRTARTGVSLRRTTFSMNSAGDLGGALYMEGQKSDLYCFADTTVTENEAQYGAGFLLASPSTVDLTGVFFVENVAGERGGGMALVLEMEEESTVRGRTLVFDGNEAEEGAALLLVVARNLDVEGSLRPIFIDRDPTISIELADVTFVDNEAEDGDNVLIRGTSEGPPEEIEGPSIGEQEPFATRVLFSEDVLKSRAVGGPTLVHEDDGCQNCTATSRVFFGPDAPRRFVNIFRRRDEGLECTECSDETASPTCPTCALLFFSLSL